MSTTPVSEHLKATVGRALGRVPSGVYIMTARQGGQSLAMMVSWVQQTLEPGAKSTEEFTSTSYFVAPGTGVQENCGSNISSAVIRSVTAGVVVEGQDQ